MFSIFFERRSSLLDVIPDSIRSPSDRIQNHLSSYVSDVSDGAGGWEISSATTGTIPGTTLEPKWLRVIPGIVLVLQNIRKPRFQCAREKNLLPDPPGRQMNLLESHCPERVSYIKIEEIPGLAGKYIN